MGKASRKHLLKAFGKFSFAGFLVFLFAWSVNAATHSGVTMPDVRELNGKTLVLNGMGVRKVSFLGIKGYVAGLYLEKKSQDAAAILASPSAKIIHMQYLRDIDRDRIVGAFNESFANNCKEGCQLPKPEVDQFISLLPAVKKNDTMTFIFSGVTVEVLIRDKKVATIESEPFARLLLSTWLGVPPNEELKRALLGN